MENDTTTPVEVEQVPAEEAVQADQQTEEQQAEAKARRVVRLMASEIELPDFDDSDIELPDEARARVRERLDAFYQKAEETAGQLNRGVDSKFKEAAALRAALEQERENVTQWRQQQEDLITKSREAAVIYEQIKDYENVDWYGQIAKAPDEESKQSIRDLRDWYDSQHKKLIGIAGQVRSVREQEAQQSQMEDQRITQAGEQILKQRIKNWGPETKAQIIKALPEFGIGKTHPRLDKLAMEALAKHPGLVEMAYEATLWRKSQKGVEAASQQAALAPARPASKVGGNATAAKDPDKMTTDEWVKWRESSLRKK